MHKCVELSHSRGGDRERERDRETHTHTVSQRFTPLLLHLPLPSKKCSKSLLREKKTQTL